jgi:hypothetical protein
LSLNELCLRYIPKQCNDIQFFDFVFHIEISS